MEYTRLDTAKLQVAVDKASKKIEEALDLLAPYIEPLTDLERASLVRPRAGFDEAGRKLALEAKHHPEIAKAASFEPDAVVEDLNNVRVLSPLLALASKVDQLVADGQLLWNAEAYYPALVFYGLAKVAARDSGALRGVIEPMAEIFPAGKRKKKDEPAKK